MWDPCPHDITCLHEIQILSFQETSCWIWPSTLMRAVNVGPENMLGEGSTWSKSMFTSPFPEAPSIEWKSCLFTLANPAKSDTDPRGYFLVLMVCVFCENFCRWGRPILECRSRICLDVRMLGLEFSVELHLKRCCQTSVAPQGSL